MSASKQQSVPPQPPPPVAGRSSKSHRAGWPDMFVDMLEGLALRLDVGSNENLRMFILPCSLLAQHSLYIYTCLFLSHKSFETAKKRKLSDVSREQGPADNTARTKGVDVAIKVESDTDGDELKAEKEKLRTYIQLPDVDPTIFGLFLHYIYRDAYPSHVDTVVLSVLRQQLSQPPTTLNPVPPVPQQPPSGNLPVRTEPAQRPCLSPGASSTTNIPGTPTTAQHSSKASTSAFNSKAAEKITLPPLNQLHQLTSSTLPRLAPKPTLPPPSTPVLPNRQPINTDLLFTSLPASVQAHFLGYRLGACAFINYTMTRIHGALGTSVRLAPGLILAIWHFTQSAPQMPLRRLILDFLVTYWSHPDPHVRKSYICPDERGWDSIFDTCKDVRSYLISGMQKGVKISVPEAYHITKQMMMDCDWERIGRVQKSGPGAGAGPRTGPDTYPGAGERMGGAA